MANKQSGSPLRRWRPFYGAFGAIDDAIEEAGGQPRAAFRDMRVRIVQLLRGATDDGVAEQLCAALDDVMVESLETLRVAPVPHSALASADLERAVSGLGNHGLPRIRSLAGDVVHGWRRPSIDKEKKLSGEEADKEKLYIPTAKTLPSASAVEAHKKKVFAPPAKMSLTAATVLTPKTSETKKPAAAESKKMEDTKRKLREGYQEAERIKRQHTIQKIDDKEAAKMFEQKQRKMQPIVRGRGPASCRSRTFTGVRRSLLPSLQMI